MCVHSSFPESIFHCLDDGAEDRTPPDPGAVSDNVRRGGVEWSVVRVMLAHLVTTSVDTRVYNVLSVVRVMLALLVRRTIHYQRGHTSLQCVECRAC